MQKIARWEACSENSAEFRAAAAQIDAELQSETRRGVVTVTDIDDDVDGDDTPHAAPGHVHYASTEAPGADDSDVDSAAADESDEYESSFIDDDELSSVQGSESSASSICETSESSEDDCYSSYYSTTYISSSLRWLSGSPRRPAESAAAKEPLARAGTPTSSAFPSTP